MSCEGKVNKRCIKEYFPRFTSHRLLEGRGAGLGYRIPKLSGAKVDVVDAK
jgi:hypothetical protein